MSFTSWGDPDNFALTGTCICDYCYFRSVCSHLSAYQATVYIFVYNVYVCVCVCMCVCVCVCVYVCTCR